MNTQKKRGRKVGTMVLTKPNIAALALEQLDSEAKEQLVLRTIAPKDRKTPSGLGVGDKVRFICDQSRMESEYPDHNVVSIYVITKILYPFESSSGWYECVLSLAGELMGYVNPDDLAVIH